MALRRFYIKLSKPANIFFKWLPLVFLIGRTGRKHPGKSRPIMWVTRQPRAAVRVARSHDPARHRRVSQEHIYGIIHNA